MHFGRALARVTTYIRLASYLPLLNFQPPTPACYLNYPTICYDALTRERGCLYLFTTATGFAEPFPRLRFACTTWYLETVLSGPRHT